MTKIKEAFNRLKGKIAATTRALKEGWLGSRAVPEPVAAPAARPEGRSKSYTKRGPGRVHAYGPGGCVKLRKRVSREVGAVANPFCPTGTDPDPKYMHAAKRNAVLSAGKTGL